jgi:hypothetical protein
VEANTADQRQVKMSPGDRISSDAERVREALIQAALEGYEQAAVSGLCEEGRWEAAISAMRRLDLGAPTANPPER